jgi:ferredoxin
VPTPAGSLFKRLEIARRALEVDAVINLPKLKTHTQMLLTLGVKNLFGTIVAQRKAEWHFMTGLDRDTFASLHLDIYLTVKPCLTLLDGVWGMDGHGPSNGRPRPLRMIAAAEDAVALDVGICHILGVPLQTFPLYRTARSRAIGETEISRMEFRGEPIEGLRVRDFRVPALDSLGFLPGGLTGPAGRYLVSRPVHEAGRCLGCGQCREICPAGAIVLSGKRIDFDYKRCIRCYCCQEICPEDAIAFKKGWIVRVLNRLQR